VFKLGAEKYNPDISWEFINEICNTPHILYQRFVLLS